ncbi:MAG: hypothetical protein CVV23_03675 [Ignavibacteriae bacterium HGW-Ignavibacteriae-2]|jgi:serine/threonine protein kinase/tetratricopeptide (TPR) repeat protein|nr:MAG: hypothetical protein CVV23_03675 [Ignavibacteriae bacterium HGW-Ignavibacteriae-2]
MINNRYKLLGKIGEGRSRVFLCSDLLNSKKEFAIKVLSGKSDKDELSSFLHEYYLLRKLDHPNIISAYEKGTILSLEKNSVGEEISVGDKFIILEYFRGQELNQFADISEETIKEILSQINSVLYYLHQSNYIYFDLKPENILISVVNQKLTIKFIDFGFVKYFSSVDSFVSRGTKEYIAPEIIKKEHTDHRADLYSLGMLLYRIIFKEFPFKAEKEIDIYRAQISENVKVPEIDYSFPLQRAITRLLSKNPSERYYTTLQIFDFLGLEIDRFRKEWGIIPYYVGRDEILSNIKNYINNSDESKIFLITGQEGSGKSEILNQIENNYERVVNLSVLADGPLNNFAVDFIDRLVYTDFIHDELDSSLISYIANHINYDSEDLIGQLKSIIAKIANLNNFVLLIDNIENFEPLSLEILQSVLPILQSNNIKIILTEDINSGLSQSLFRNIIVDQLVPFTDEELGHFIDKSYAAFFPREKLLEMIKEFSDFLPGSVIKFIDNLIYLKILDYTSEGAIIQYSPEDKKAIEESLSQLFKNRIQDLNYKEFSYIKTVSALKETLPESVVALICGFNDLESNLVLQSLRDKLILLRSKKSINPEFTSNSLRNYVYNLTNGNSNLHEKISSKLVELNDDRYISELAFQFEKAGDYNSSYKYYKIFIDKAGSVSAYATKRLILEKLSEFNLPQNLHLEINIDISETLYKLAEFNACLDLTNRMLELQLEAKTRQKLTIQKAVCFARIGELSKSKKLIEEILTEDLTSKERINIKYELSLIELELNNYDIIPKYCSEMLEEQEVTFLEKGKINNMLGLVEIYKNNDLNSALKYFYETLNNYEKTKDIMQIAAVEVNIGNIYNMLMDSKSAKNHWNKALHLNQSVGNVEQEAKILMNTGIYHFNQNEFEKAIEQYKRANNIFSGIAYIFGNGLALTNLGETYCETCEYSKAIESLEEAQLIFTELNNTDELFESFFHLAKIYYRLNSRKQLDELIDKMIRISKDKKVNRISYINKIAAFFAENLAGMEIKLDDLESLIQDASTNNDSILLMELFTQKIDLLLNNSSCEVVSNFVNDFNVKSLSEKNNINDAWWNLQHSKISAQYSEQATEPEINFLNKAYELIEHETITELTLIIIYGLFEYYKERGNIKKATNYAHYFKSIYDFILANIPAQELKENYRKKKFLQSAFPKINSVIEKKL